MNNLEKIQKTMKVFQILTKIVMVFSDCLYISGWQRKFDGR